MNKKTHKNLARIFRPDIPGYKIDKVNSAIDNPSRRMLVFKSSGVNSAGLDAFGLAKNGGHRRWNHTMESAIMAAYAVDHEHAADLAMIHLMADKMSNYLIDQYGSDNRDIIEGMINKFYTLSKQASGQKMRKTRRMFY